MAKVIDKSSAKALLSYFSALLLSLASKPNIRNMLTSAYKSRGSVIVKTKLLHFSFNPNGQGPSYPLVVFQI